MTETRRSRWLRWPLERPAAREHTSGNDKNASDRTVLIGCRWCVLAQRLWREANANARSHLRRPRRMAFPPCVSVSLRLRDGTARSVEQDFDMIAVLHRRMHATGL